VPGHFPEAFRWTIPLLSGPLPLPVAAAAPVGSGALGYWDTGGGQRRGVALRDLPILAIGRLALSLVSESCAVVVAVEAVVAIVRLLRDHPHTVGRLTRICDIRRPREMEIVARLGILRETAFPNAAAAITATKTQRQSGRPTGLGSSCCRPDPLRSR
jgi:hypothetical protein